MFCSHFRPMRMLKNTFATILIPGKDDFMVRTKVYTRYVRPPASAGMISRRIREKHTACTVVVVISQKENKKNKGTMRKKS